MSMADHVKKTCEQGLVVFPVSSENLEPGVAYSQDSEVFFSWQDAQRFWEMFPDAPYAVRGGQGTEEGKHFVILDVDDNGDTKLGFDSLDALEEKYGRLPPTRRVESPSGGDHFYFWCRHQVNQSLGKIGKHLDIKGFHNYVIGPGVQRKDIKGKKDGPYLLADDLPIAELPDWLYQLCTEEKDNPASNGHTTHFDAEPRDIGDGERNEWLWKKACALAGEGKALGEIQALMRHYNEQVFTRPHDSQKLESICERASNFKPNVSPRFRALEEQAAAFIDTVKETKQKEVNLISDRKLKKDGSKLLGSSRQVQCYSMENMWPKKPEYLFGDWFPKKEISLIAGKPGVSKTTFALKVAAAVSTGGEIYPGAGKAELGTVVIITTEDGISTTILPRLLAAGADPKRCAYVPNVQFEDDIEDFRQVMDEVGEAQGKVSLVILDPITAFVARGGSDNSNLDVRRLSGLLTDYAEDNEVSIIGITHLRKAPTSGHVGHGLDAIVGSGGWGAAARAAYFISQDKEVENAGYITCAKNTNGENTPTMIFHRVTKEILSGPLRNEPAEFVTITLKHYDGDLSAEEIIEISQGCTQKAVKGEQLQSWMVSLAQNQGCNSRLQSSEIRQMAEEQGFGWRTVEKVKKELNIQSVKVNGVWCWDFSGMEETSHS